MYVLVPILALLITAYFIATKKTIKRKTMDIVSEKELAQKYLNLAGTIIIVLDQKGEVSLINQKGCNIIGMEEEDIIGKNWIENFIPKDIVSDVKKVFDNVFSEKIEMSKHHENTIITSNKEERIIAWDNNILYNSDGIITGIISSGEDVTEIRKKEVELCYLSYHDELTGLYNRRFFEEQIKRLDNPRNLPLSIVMGDVNGLKLTNDAFGHKAGDEILKMIGNIIATSIRGNDIATRWGGDEFVILLPSTGTDAAAMLINRIQEKIKNASFEYGIVSISFGVSAKKHRHDDINDIFTSAEELMYEKKLIDIDYIGGGAIDAIMNSLFKKSVKEKNHSTRVSELSVLIAENMGLSKAKINDIKIIGLIHDIGKIAIDLDILDKFGELTDEEKSIIQQHSLFGSKMLNSSHEYSRLALGVLHHHERIDGKGYPTGITGDQIPIESKIIAVTDSFDAMTAERPYRLNPFSLEEAISELRKHTGTQFDKTVVDIFINKVLSNHNTI
jgi:diguanylate cyclase (GGDEF)-like protein/PAS domain S-box-containing protein